MPNRLFTYFSFNSSNLAAIVGLFFVNLLMLKSSALLFANLKLFSEDNNASFVFCRWSIVLSISSIAFWNFSLASLKFLENLSLKSFISASKLETSTFCALMISSYLLYSSEFPAAFLNRVIIGIKNCGLITYILGYLCDISTIPAL